MFCCYPLAAIVPKTLSPRPSHGMTLKQLGITTIGSKVVKISVYLGVGAAFVGGVAIFILVDDALYRRRRCDRIAIGKRHSNERCISRVIDS